MYDQIYQPIASLANAKILLVCDDQETERIWVDGLRVQLLEAVLTFSAEDGLKTWSEFSPDFFH